MIMVILLMRVTTIMVVRSIAIIRETFDVTLVLLAMMVTVMGAVTEGGIS